VPKSLSSKDVNPEDKGRRRPDMQEEKVEKENQTAVGKKKRMKQGPSWKNNSQGKLMERCTA
jgi:hypothetical protein